MSDYKKLIENTPLVEDVEITMTTGDLDYEGTALEIVTSDGDELFHIVVDQNGQSQFLFFRSEGNFRFSMELMDRVIEAGKKHLRMIRES